MFEQYKDKMRSASSAGVSFGEILEVNERLLVAKGPYCKIGDRCEVGENSVLCEVIAVETSRVTLMPFQKAIGVYAGDKVVKSERGFQIPLPTMLLGQVLNAFGEVLSDPSLLGSTAISLERTPPHALARKPVRTPFETGIRAVDALLTMGVGQRIGLFAGTGVGKTTLMGMMAKRTKSDVNVVALIGERGREVNDFIQKSLGREGMANTILIVSTSDEGPLMNIRAAQLAMSIAEVFRDEGKQVLFMMDSITRFAMAKREVDVARGEVPMNGKTPSMEPAMQELLERAGNDSTGSITGIFTVLVEGDDFEGTIPDTARGILDGHIVLSRQLANQNRFPAIDIQASVSRVMEDVVQPEHWARARVFQKYYALYKENEDAFLYGAYQMGQNQEIDMAKYLYPKMTQFLLQQVEETSTFEETYAQMEKLLK